MKKDTGILKRTCDSQCLFNLEPKPHFARGRAMLYRESRNFSDCFNCCLGKGVELDGLLDQFGYHPRRKEGI